MKKALVYTAPKAYEYFLERGTSTPLGLVDVPEDLEYKFRIMEELSQMALDECPVVHPPKHLEHVPLALWPKQAFKNETYEKIDDVCLRYEKEVDTEYLEIVNKVFGTTFKREEVLVEYCLPTDKDKEESIQTILFIIPN